MVQKKLVFTGCALLLAALFLGTMIYSPDSGIKLMRPLQKGAAWVKAGMVATNENMKTLDGVLITPKVRAVDCKLIWTGDKNETQKAIEVQKSINQTLKTLSQFRNSTWDCGRYIQHGGFNLASVSEEELSFPVAFSLLVYRDADQVERFLRAIYRPHNVYCIHVDFKADNSYRRRIELMASCLSNVFVSSVVVDVRWGRFTNLEPEVICMRQLWKHEVKWKYFINLTGQEFALKTNKELVRILKAFQGANGISGNPTANVDRWKKYLPAPYNVTIYKGAVHIVASRGYVDYVLHSKVGQALFNWVKPTGHPDESYFNTLNFNTKLGVPGSTTVNFTKGSYGNFNRHKIWGDRSKCAGKFVRGICHFGVGDLPRLTSSPQLIANKFSYDHQPLAYDCLEEWYFHKVQLEEAGTPWPLNDSLYSHSDMVKQIHWAYQDMAMGQKTHARARSTLEGAIT
ncbi:hypothetical protein V1264_022271 [Littorina saxatilis]|uniref:Uncharacterized protein n=1 Tax=Littorina saxatilis TaxID=31220 RepID=A0AAN9AK08_9CAEN